MIGKEIVNNCLEDLKEDDMPLHDLVRIFSGYYRVPNESDFNQALMLITELYKNQSVYFYFGEKTNKIDLPINELLKWLMDEWKNGNYEDINYGLWARESE